MENIKLYWVSAIIQNEWDARAKLLARHEGELSIDKAMREIDYIKSYNTVLSAWIDVFDENGIKETVYHDCYVDSFGDLRGR